MSLSLEQRLEQWLHHLTLRRAIPSLAFILFLIAWNRGIALLYGMTALLIATLFIAYLSPRFNLRGVSVSRHAPRSANEGETITLEYSLEQRGLLPRYMLELFDRLPFAVTTEKYPVAFIDQLKGESRLSVPMVCELRGEHTLGPIRLHSSYPLGIHHSERTLGDEGEQILVYPGTFPIHSLPLVGSSQSPTSGTMASSAGGGNETFFGIREYRHGDNPRHVHWAATAKYGELVVKQYEYIHNTRVLIVLDLHTQAQYGEGRESTLEYAVRIAASVARFALAQGHQVGLLGYGRELLDIPLGHGNGHYQTILEALARVRADGDTPYRQATHHAVAQLPGGGILFLFEMVAAHQAAEKLEMYQHHIRPLRVRFNTASFLHPAEEERTRRYTPALHEGIYSVQCGDDLARVFAQ